MKTTFLGLIGAVLITAYAIISTVESSLVYLNIVGIIIVVGGTLCAGILTFGIKDIVSIILIALKVFAKDKESGSKAVVDLVEISKIYSKDKTKAFKQIQEMKVHHFIKDGMRLLQNELSTEQIETIMATAIKERRDFHLHQVDVIKTLAKYPPSFGMIGTVIGLVGILQNLGDTGAVDKMGGAMAVALITTLYGLFLSNYLFIPVGDNMLHRLDNDLRVRRIILDAILLMAEGEDTIYIQENLMVHLNPSKRKELNAQLA